jgi:hypothetical protein
VSAQLDRALAALTPADRAQLVVALGRLVT